MTLTSTELPGSPRLLDAGSGLLCVTSSQSCRLWEQFVYHPPGGLLPAPLSTGLHGFQLHGFQPNSSIPVFWSAAIDVLDARLCEDTAGYLRAKQPPFLVVSLCFFHLPWKAWARQDFVEGWGGEFINGSCAGLIVVLQTSHFIFNNNLRFRQDVYGLLSLLLKDYTSFWMFLL